MDTKLVTRVFPPGDFIQEELDARGWTQGDLATMLGQSTQRISELISGEQAITGETAKALARAFGTNPELWMNLESAWRLPKAESPIISG